MYDYRHNSKLSQHLQERRRARFRWNTHDVIMTAVPVVILVFAVGYFIAIVTFLGVIGKGIHDYGVRGVLEAVWCGTEEPEGCLNSDREALKEFMHDLFANNKDNEA